VPVVTNTFSLSRLKWAPPDGRSRVFIEDADPGRYQLAARALSEIGYQVGPFCGGSHFHEAVFTNGRVPPCPLVRQGGCTLLEEAEVIVFRYGLESPENRLVLDLIRHRYPEVPVVVEASPDERAQHAQLLAGYEVVAAPATLDGLVAAVHTALAERTLPG
jgi:hypothetical protein